MHQKFLALFLAAPVLAASPCGLADHAGASRDAQAEVRQVQGTGVHFFTTAIVHGSQPTPAGMIQTSTETVELDGDIRGRILYHPVSVFDFQNGTLVNTGHQVFSGTILGSAPVLLHDDSFRFEVDLATGDTTGQVHLTDDLAGPGIRCHLEVVDAGMTAEGNAMFSYEGHCRMKNGDQAARSEGAQQR